MATDFDDFIKSIQSINSETLTGTVLFCNGINRATEIQKYLLENFHISSITDKDNNGFYYVVPLEKPTKEMLLNFLRRGFDWDKDQKFIQHTITFYDKYTTTNMYNILIARGYNVSLLSNNMQLMVKCLDNSQNNDVIQSLKRELLISEKSSPQSMDDYFNKILFNGKIENFEYRKAIKQEFDIETIKQNKDIIIREILYQYFNKKIRAHLSLITFPRKFDANKLNDKVKQNINLIREYLYSVAQEYIKAQLSTAIKTNHKVSVRFDYLKSCNKYHDFHIVLKQAKRWHKDSENIDKKRQKLCKISEKGTYRVMNFDDGYYVVQLFTPQSLDFETICLGHCVGNGHYDDKVHKESVQIYSIRDKTGYPHLTLEVRNNKIVQCEGRKNYTPRDPKLREKVRALMREQHLDIDKWDGLIAYVKQDGVLYDIFDMPKNFVLKGSLDLCAMKFIKLPDMKSITIKHSFICSTNCLSDLTGAPHTVGGNVEFSNNPLISLYGMPRNIGGDIYLSHTHLTRNSFVPIYMENKLDDVVGISANVINAWKQQIADRKNTIANIIASLSNRYTK